MSIPSSVEKFSKAAETFQDCLRKDAEVFSKAENFDAETRNSMREVADRLDGFLGTLRMDQSLLKTPEAMEGVLACSLLLQGLDGSLELLRVLLYTRERLAQ